MPPLGPEFFARDTLEVARDLLGCRLVRELDGRRLGGRLVEVEAYLGPDDRAAHSWRGLTPRTATMYGPPGRAYVYLVYGLHHCLNFVTRPEGAPQAILVRALAPDPGTGRCSGPGLVCRALEIDRGLDGVPLRPPGLWVEAAERGKPAGRVFQTRRIGVDYAGEWADRPWRFCLDSPALSRPLPRSARV
ncbi:MAG: DNA-3-methyladenine glycosylase [Candidatus Dormibacteraeota bacterium]|nr:DNA-3-methyladenine glycosylase [Candidatus Dormibacteraeota bacterium]